MAISDRIQEALEKVSKGDQLNALIQISIAIDATGKKIFPGKKTSYRSKQFLKENIGFITRCAFGNLEVQGPMTFEVEGSDEAKSLESILYGLVRCSLLHEGELSDKIQLTDKNSIGLTEDGKFILSSSLIWGMLLAVIANPANEDQKVLTPLTFNLGNATYKISDLLGKKEFILNRLRELNKGEA